MPRHNLALMLGGALGERVERSVTEAGASPELEALFERAEREQASDEELALAACLLGVLCERESSGPPKAAAANRESGERDPCARSPLGS